MFREENSGRTVVKFAVRGCDLGSLIADAKQRVAAGVKLSIGYRMGWTTGAFENQQRAVERLELPPPDPTPRQ